MKRTLKAGGLLRAKVRPYHSPPPGPCPRDRPGSLLRQPRSQAATLGGLGRQSGGGSARGSRRPLSRTTPRARVTGAGFGASAEDTQLTAEAIPVPRPRASGRRLRGVGALPGTRAFHSRLRARHQSHCCHEEGTLKSRGRSLAFLAPRTTQLHKPSNAEETRGNLPNALANPSPGLCGVQLK